MLDRILEQCRKRVAQSRIGRLGDKNCITHKKLGTAYGGWYVPVSLLSTNSICYCVGAGEDISFEVELINQFNCNVYTFDPTPRARKHFETLRQNTNRRTKTFLHNGPN